MEWNDEAMKRRARRAYEWGRLKHAARRVWLPFVLVFVSEVACGCTPVSYGVIAALVVTTVVLGWRGGDYERAIAPATVGGGIAFLAPLCGAAAGLANDALVAVCFTGGVGAGALLALWAVRQRIPIRGALIAAAVHAGLVGALGCAVVGAGALLGMGAGLFIASAPAWGRPRVA